MIFFDYDVVGAIAELAQKMVGIVIRHGFFIVEYQYHVFERDHCVFANVKHHYVHPSPLFG